MKYRVNRIEGGLIESSFFPSIEEAITFIKAGLGTTLRRYYEETHGVFASEKAHIKRLVKYLDFDTSAMFRDGHMYYTLRKEKGEKGEKDE